MTGFSSGASMAFSADKLLANVTLDVIPLAMNRAGVTPSPGTANALGALRAFINGNVKTAGSQVPTFSPCGVPAAESDDVDETDDCGGSSASAGLMQSMMSIVKLMMKMLRSQIASSGAGTPRCNPTASGVGRHLQGCVGRDIPVAPPASRPMPPLAGPRLPGESLTAYVKRLDRSVNDSVAAFVAR